MSEAIQNMQAIKSIKQRMASGQLTYEQAKTEAMPVIDRINIRAADIAKKHGMRRHNVTFAELVR